MNSIINLDKPKGMSSQQAVTKVKRLLGAKKAGHTGTLDPMASGVLLVCLNEATKISRFLLDHDKTYHATLRLGERTDTLDAEGKVTEIREVPDLSSDEVMNVFKGFVGRIMQKPPMYSAIKKNGQPLYKMARSGVEVERDERPVTIHFIRLLGMNLPYIEFEVSCSKGTYIRTLCDDIGQRLGTGAHLVELRRSRIGRFDIENAGTFEILETGISDGVKFVHSIDSAISEMPELILDETSFIKARNGISISLVSQPDMPLNSHVRLKGPGGNLFGIGCMDNEKIIIERNLNL